jgi:hypothetical protein
MMLQNDEKVRNKEEVRNDTPPPWTKDRRTAEQFASLGPKSRKLPSN